KFLLYWFNKFDFFVRFAYTRIPFVRDIAWNLLFSLLYTSAGDKVYKIYSRVKETLDRYNIAAEGKNVTEIGPGMSLIMAFCMLKDGAREILLADKFSRWDKNVVADELNYLEDKNISDIRRFLDNFFKPDSKYIKYIENSASP
ncbi:MAG: hypothetical protein MUC95_08380, partial [Spirochaetes bacterium]|nr:hypothetical protein [Spirochaetota bacterium]